MLIDNEAWKDARKNLQTSPKWASYWQNIPSRKSPTSEECADLLISVDLQPQKIEKIQTLDPFVDRSEFLGFLLGTFTPAVPSKMANEFYNDLIDEYLRLMPSAISSDGVIQARFSRIENRSCSRRIELNSLFKRIGFSQLIDWNFCT